MTSQPIGLAFGAGAFRHRAVAQAAFAYACYMGEYEGKQYHGLHVGILGTLDEAVAWLNGDPTVHPHPIAEMFNA